MPFCKLNLNLIRVTSKYKRWAVLIITFKFMSFISILFYWRITQEIKHKSWHYSLPIEVKCPPLSVLFPPISPATSLPSPLPRKIYFVETSESIRPNFLFICSVESAARAHPESNIMVLMKGLASHNVTLPKQGIISLLSCFPNIKIKPLHMKDLFSDTPLAGWYSLAQQRWEPYFLPILSDACRIALMWKFGGIYLDTDFIVLKNLNNLTNMFGTQSKYVLNGAFLSFKPKHDFIRLCMQDFVANYNRWIWGHQGPQLFTRVFKKWCSIRSLQNSKSCRGVTVLPREAFYPIHWQDWKIFFKDVKPLEMSKMFKNTHAVHVWNQKSQGTRFQISSEALLVQLQSHYCPSTYELMKVYV